MDWIKRNLYFVIGSALALILMGLAGFYLYSKWQLNNEIMEKLNADYATLDSLYKENPHPGSGQVDNIKAASEQQQQLLAVMKKCRDFFQPVPMIPDVPKITDREFAFALSRTIDRLQREATNSSVALPPDFSFSFTAQRPRATFSPVNLGALAVQLGEIKAICDILFQAKINSLDSIRRERVSVDDYSGSALDYIDVSSITNEQAVVAPYALTFRSFSSELAAVLSGLGSSRYGMVVTMINVEPADSPPLGADTGLSGEAAPGYMPTPGYPGSPGTEGAGGFARRYGGRTYQPATAAASTATRPGALPTVLDEKPLRVTLVVNIVKLLPRR